MTAVFGESETNRQPSSSRYLTSAGLPQMTRNDAGDPKIIEPVTRYAVVHARCYFFTSRPSSSDPSSGSTRPLEKRSGRFGRARLRFALERKASATTVGAYE